MNRASLVLSAVLAVGAVAHAQPATPPPPNPAADAAYQEARRLYDLREWDAAIGKFKEAYRLRPDAASLFNIAQSNRLKGDCGEALHFYKTYKRNFPGEKNLDKVEKFITEMEECVAKGGGTKTEPVKTEPVKTEPVKTEPNKVIVSGSSDPGKTKRLAGLAIGGAGVLSLGAGVFFGLRARSAASDAESAMMGDPWNPGIETRGENAQRNSRIALGLGTALVATGVVLYVLGRKSSSEAANVTIVPTKDGASLAWATGF